MKLRHLYLTLAIPALHADEWKIESAEDWKTQTEKSAGITFTDDTAAPTAERATLLTKLHRSDKKRSPKSLTITQSALWHNWNPTTANLGPSNLADAPVLLVKGPNDYWMFGRYGNGQPRRKKGQAAPKTRLPFKAEDATLEGFDIPLKTTPFKNQYNAPGGLGKSLGGYHAWQSRDMKSWVHHGPVTDRVSKWVTNAEFVDGKTLIYYDFPNDQDPHVYVDSDLTDGKPGENKGMVVSDPSHGSDAGFIRSLDGKVHCIIEDWSPISANQHAWDSPLAGHFVSTDGISSFVHKSNPVDHRTQATGKTGTYTHPHWAKEDPKNYPTNIAKYQIHEPKQNAYGDWAPICIGGQYYIFGDFDPAAENKMSVGWFTSSSIDGEFTWCGNIGNGHPDPDICFAEGQFYLATQQKTDFTSPGPWVEKVEARVGVDTTNDGKIDQWGQWSELKESYDYIKGFSKQIKRIPARLDLSSLPDGFGFQIELKLTDTTENKSKPIIEGLRLTFE